MKKVLSTVLVIGILLSSASCVSQSQYDELEQRVAALENERNANITEVASVSSESDTNETTSIVESEESLPPEVTGIYSLDGLSSDEIVNLMITYVATPAEGSTDDNFMARFPDNPYGIFSSGNGGGIDFPSGTYRDTVYASNYIDIIQWYYSHNMDGTISLTDEYNSLISITVYISDYDTAVAIYESLRSVAYDKYDNIQESTEGSNWVLNDLDYYWYDTSVLSLSLTDSGYRITYINYFA